MAINDLGAAPSAYNDGAIAQAVIQIGKDVADIKANMVYRNEYNVAQAATIQRIAGLESSPATFRDWLGVLIAGAGCLGSLFLSLLAIGVTIALFIASQQR